jgi:hypothetical protein
MSQNQLGSWTINDSSIGLHGHPTKIEKINDYYECLIEAGTNKSSKRICKQLMIEN